MRSRSRCSCVYKHNQRQQHVPILIVGAGFSGLVTALLLRQQGLDFRIIEKQQLADYQQSNAHYLNAHTIEILVALGIAIADLRRAAVTMEDSMRMVICHTLNHSLYCLDLADDKSYKERFNRVGRYGAHMNVRGAYLHQLLREALVRAGITIEWGVALQELDVVNKHMLLARENGDQDHVRYDILLACDGASSRVRKCANIPQKKSYHMDFLTIECHGSIESYVTDRALLYWIYHEQLTACMVAFDPAKLQVLQIPLLDPHQDSAEIIATMPKRFAAMCGVGANNLTHQFRPSGRWRCQTGIAEPEHTKFGIYLLGDAWHQVLPAGGMGLNLAIADAYNLIWKLVADVRGHKAWLSTYATERFPIAKHSVEQSISNFQGFLQMGEGLLPKFLQGSVGWVQPLSQQPFWQVAQSSWLMSQRRWHEFRGHAGANLAQVCEHNRSHFDGIAMHQPLSIDSLLTYKATKRRFYDLAVLPHQIDVGRPLQHFCTLVDGRDAYLSEFLDYSHWTFFTFDASRLEGWIDRLQIALRVVQMTWKDGTLLNRQELIVVRPDRVVFAVVNQNDDCALQEFWQYCEQVFSKG